MQLTKKTSNRALARAGPAECQNSVSFFPFFLIGYRYRVFLLCFVFPHQMFRHPLALFLPSLQFLLQHPPLFLSTLQSLSSR